MANAAQNYVTVLGCGGEAEPSVCVTTKTERILFNCPEGTQRMMTEHKLRISNKLHSAFFTRSSWHCCSGITDVILKCAEEGQRNLGLVGPRVRDYTLSTSFFLGQRPDMTLKLSSLPSLDSTLPPPLSKFTMPGGTTVSPILLSPNPAPPSTHKRTHDQMSGGEGAGEEEGGAVLPSTAASLSLVEGGEETGTSNLSLCYSPYHRARPHSRRATPAPAVSDGRAFERKTAVCYVVELPNLPGKVDMSKAKELGVPQGPLLGKLVKGQSVTLKDGTVVDPGQCVGVGKSAGVVIIVDCPSTLHVPPLTSHPSLAPFLAPATTKDPPQLLIVHLTPLKVLASEGYKAWAEGLPSHATQWVVDQGATPQRAPHCASERYLKLLHINAPSLFPLSHSPYPSLSLLGNAIKGSLPPTQDSLCKAAVKAWPMLRYVMLPHKTPGMVSDVPETAFLHNYCIRSCICDKPTTPTPTPEGAEGWRIVFLGTGASAPFKYRTVSSIILTLPGGDGDVMLDAGDGSYGAMVRKWGVEGADERLRNLKMLWVSHKHADHISGTAKLLLKRRQALGGSGGKAGEQQGTPCSVCGSRFGVQTSMDMHVRACHPRQKHVGQGGLDARAEARGVGSVGADGGGPLLIVGPMWLDAWLRKLSAQEEDLNYVFIDAQELVAQGAGAHTGMLEGLMGCEVKTVIVQHSFPAYGIKVKHNKSGFSCVYSGDTRPSDDLVNLGKGSTVLLHEATHADDMVQKAVSDRHCTVEEAVGVAHRMGVGRCVLTHFSSRFEKLIPDLERYGDKASNIGCAFDSMELSEKDAETLPKTTRRLYEVLAAEYKEDDDE